MKTKTEQATARPWRNGVKHPCRIFTDRESVSARQPVGSTCEIIDEGTETDEQKANAALIVQAVNEWEALNTVAEHAQLLTESFKRMVKDWQYMDKQHAALFRVESALAILSAIRAKGGE